MKRKILEKTKRKIYGTDRVIESMPVGGKVGNLEFFKPGLIFHSNVELEKEYELRGLIPASPEVICKYDIKNPKQMDTMGYVATIWRDTRGNWCIAQFYHWSDERRVDVFHDDRTWRSLWWFCGIKKEPFNTPKSILDSLPLEININGVTYKRV